MLKNKLPAYSSGVLIGIFICSALIGLGGSAYKQKSRLKDILKSYYYKLQKPEQVKSGIQNSDIDTEKEIRLYIEPSKEIGKISPLLFGTNLSPQTETGANVVNFINSTGITCFRYPGGESPGYRWKTGTFDFSSRYINAPLRKINFLIDFCRNTNTKLIMQVNIESASAKEAAELVEYMNKKANFPVEYWELGNEVYGDWDKAYMTGDKYAKVIKTFALGMKRTDPNIKIGVDWAPQRHQSFNKAVVKGAGKYIDFISCHWYPNHTQAAKPFNGRIHPLPKDVMANYLQIPEVIRSAKEIFARYAPGKKNALEFSFLEWDGAWDGPSYDTFPYTKDGIVQWSLANAIFHADSIGQFMLNNVSASTQFNLQSTMFGLIRGWDKDVDPDGQRWDGEIIRPKALAVKLFSKYFGDTLVENKLEGAPAYYKNNDWWPDSYKGYVPYISCYASRFSKENKLAVVLINKHESKDYKVKIYLKSIKPKSEGRLYILNGPSLMSQNEGNPVNVSIKDFKVENISQDFNYTVPAHSINLIEVYFETDEKK